MRRSATGQMQEPEDDIARITAFKLSDLVLSFLLDEAGLICGTALCRKTQELLLQLCTLQYGVRTIFRARGLIEESTMTEILKHAVLYVFAL